MSTFVLATGGTGGHVFPAVALGDHLQTLGHSVHITTDGRGAQYLDAAAALQATIILQKNLGSMNVMKRIAHLIPLCWHVRSLLKRLKPDAVVGFGGYPSFPTCVAALTLGIPVYVHEQNAVMGKVNKLLGRWCRHIMLSFPDTLGLSHALAAKATVTGNFVRSAFLAPQPPYTPPTETGPLRLVVLGGSQGAATVATSVLKAVSLLPDTVKARLYLTLQAPKTQLESLKVLWPTCAAATGAPYPVKGTLESFYTNVPELLSAAHLVVTRSGASSVWELLAQQRPAIYLPFPQAADDHQRWNAAFLTTHGAGWMLTGDELTVATLHARIKEALTEPQVLADQATHLAQLYATYYTLNPVVRAAQVLEAHTV